MIKKSINPFSATITIGLESGYEQVKISQPQIIRFVQNYQEDLIKNKGIYLSASVSECKIVLSGQVEPHLKLSFINYPKFPLPVSQLKNEIEDLAKSFMSEFRQNRTVIEYLDETVMFEQSGDIDPRIN
ncbi:MAG: hypothetical protein H6571_21265 [Lewinellaceae bacterium]|nr:hypothetical protein [Lewinellaceae bacterium]